MADVLVITFMSSNENCFIETASLDGEKTLKPKNSLIDKDLNEIFTTTQSDHVFKLHKLDLEYQNNNANL